MNDTIGYIILGVFFVAASIALYLDMLSWSKKYEKQDEDDFE